MTKPILVSRIFGGLGNQLFCYATARAVALRNSAELALDDVSGFANDHLYRRSMQLDHFGITARRATPSERMEPFARFQRLAKRRLSAIRAFEDRKYVQQEGVDFDERMLNLRPRGLVHLEGYWQSEKYFLDVAETIRSDLAITPPQDHANQALAGRIVSENSVLLHMRFFEEAAEAGGNASSGYYQRAIAEMDERVPDAHYYLFSDRPEAALAKLGMASERFTLVAHNKGDDAAYADLWLMSQCRHAIIANSTFSWWGAWLAEKPGQIVIAPGFELRSGPAWWGFDGLLPDRWIKL